MRTIVVLAVSGGALVLLAAVAIGVILSASSTGLSYLLVSVYMLDSAAILFIAWKLARWDATGSRPSEH